ncbi:MAG: 3-dehydroquinate synthase [Cyclobacteriaceae bacterium]|nr:3-dehydroquinate synthase [Cyclobacteriaceae bacterium]
MNKNITIGNIKGVLPSLLREQKYSSIAVLVDENTEKDCLPIVKGSIGDYDVIRIKSGEENKNLTTCQHIWQSLTDNGYDRHALLINLGGGVIGDMGGFCAATYKRGIAFINIPTTLLSMVDASVGGKLGVDFGTFKNHIGLFQIPNHVCIDASFLKTLPHRELRSGFAEVIKHALITKGNDWNDIVTSSFESMEWETVIHKSVAIKSEIVSKDFKESGLRKTLNFGHTIGHAIESYFLSQGIDQKILHGEAVAIGMICELYLSFHKLNFAQSDLDQIATYIVNVYGYVDVPESSFSEIIRLCGQDKKNKENKIQAVLLKSIGTAIVDSEISSEDILQSIQYYSNLNI